MATLTAGERRACWGGCMEEWSRRRVAIALAKGDLLAAVNAIDDWISDNTVSFNQALPLAARQALTPAQKAELFMFVLRSRFVNGT